jgi:hypothetical protein
MDAIREYLHRVGALIHEVDLGQDTNGSDPFGVRS